LHPKLNKYLAEVENAIKILKDCNVECYEEEVLTYKRINLRIRICFETGNLFEISEAVVVESTILKHLGYRYHFQDKDNKLILRYDNAPHHLEIETFPHHKHLPGKVTNAVKPSILNVVKEIAELYDV